VGTKHMYGFMSKVGSKIEENERYEKEKYCELS
jgi:hypothetical protein